MSVVGPARAQALNASSAALASGPSLLAIAILLLNDHFWKVDSPSWLTGKLSDLAGLFFVPYLTLLLAFALTPKAIGPRAARVIAVAAYVALGAIFVALKISPESAAPLLSLPRLVGIPVSLMSDPTDLVALGVMPLSFTIWTRALDRRGMPRMSMGLARYAVVSFATFATVATTLGDNVTPIATIAGVVTDATDPGIAYVVIRDTDAEGVYVTSDVGVSWRRIATKTGTLFRDRTSGTVLVSSRDRAFYRVGEAVSIVPLPLPNVTGEYSRAGSTFAADLSELARWSDGPWFLIRQGELFRTTDGATWTPLATPAPVQLLATARSSGVVYLAAWSYELYRSDDAGAHWRRTGGLRHVAAMIVDPSDPNILLAGSGNDLLRSQDGGSSWQVTYTEQSRAGADRARWRLQFDERTGRAYAIFGSGCCALLVSTDRGGTWTDAGITASDLAVDAGGSVYAVGPTSRRLFRGEGGSGPWKDASGDLPVKP